MNADVYIRTCIHKYKTVSSRISNKSPSWGSWGGTVPPKRGRDEIGYKNLHKNLPAYVTFKVNLNQTPSHPDNEDGKRRVYLIK